MNRVEFIGNLSKAPDVKQTTSGKTVCSLTIAVNRRYKDADGKTTADFFSVQVWGKLAEVCARYLDKGSKVFISGELRNRSYEAKDGSKRTVTEIIANEVEFLSPKTEPATPPVEEWQQVEDSDLPF
jgi:single-strand DNA-binding protein